MINPFKNIDKKDVAKILKNLESMILSFDKNVDILKKIKFKNNLAIVLKGNVDIIRIDYSGNKTIVEVLEENSIFSSKLITITESQYEMITKTNVKIIVIDFNYLLLYNNNSSYFTQFLKNLLEINVEIINTKNERIEILTKKGIRNKLLEYLNMEANKHGSKNVYLPFSYTDLSSFLAIDRSAMSRELKHLRDEGFIKINGKRITLLYR